MNLGLVDYHLEASLLLISEANLPQVQNLREDLLARLKMHVEQAA